MKPVHEYNNLQGAYEYFNHALFNDLLPVCMITLNHKRGTGGYFWEQKFVDRKSAEHTDEIALNPDSFQDLDDKFILSILVHEMVHLWQSHRGKPSRNGYHNREWALHMLRVGLISFNCKYPAKMTGQRVGHAIRPGGPFDAAVNDLLMGGFKLTWQSVPSQNDKKRLSKTKYVCPNCGVNAWAKPDTNLICGDCMEVMKLGSSSGFAQVMAGQTTKVQNGAQVKEDGIQKC